MDKKWAEALRHVSSSPALWTHRIAFLLSQGPQLSLDTILRCCIDSTMAQARHAASIHAQAKRTAAPQGSHQSAAAALRDAELAVVDAAVRHLVLLQSFGRAGDALALLQAASEWAAAPAVGVGVTLWGTSRFCQSTMRTLASLISIHRWQTGQEAMCDLKHHTCAAPLAQSVG